jgi:mannose-6-phosphate isomerase-like protein (cupin superfamily)
MKTIHTTVHTRRGFSVLGRTRSAQAATMTLAAGASSSESSANEHGWAEQWLYVVSGRGTARVNGRSVKLAPGTLLVIGKREPHLITAKTRLVTVNIYVPPAYDSHGEPLR